jgi:hypothetical protein
VCWFQIHGKQPTIQVSQHDGHSRSFPGFTQVSTFISAYKKIVFRKPRIFAPSYFFVEALTIVNFCIFNGFADAGLRALDAIHQRGIFDISPDVLLVSNAMVDLLSQEDSRALIHELETR